MDECGTHLDAIYHQAGWLNGCNHSGADAFDFPGFVPAYIRPLFCRGIGPFRWAALSGDPDDIYRTDAKGPSANNRIEQSENAESKQRGSRKFGSGYSRTTP